MEPIAVAVQATHEAGQLILGRFRKPHTVRWKAPADVVTEIDREAEELIVRRLRAAFPKHEILAEEGHQPLRNDAPLWVVDPLDGTRNYARGVPFFSVSVALCRAGKTVLGVIHDPLHGETFVARRGKGAELNGQPLRPPRKEHLADALVAVGSTAARNPADRNLSLPIFARMRPLVEAVRMSGSAALNVAYVACGRWDITFSDNVHPWDILAGVLLIEETGGIATDFDGNPISLASRDIIAANVPAFHQQVLELARPIVAAHDPGGPAHDTLSP